MSDKTVLSKEEYQSAEDISEVGDMMENRGVELPDTGEERKKEVYKFAREEWWELNREKQPYERPTELPGSSLEYGGFKVNIHGLVHVRLEESEENGELELKPPAVEVRDFVNQEVQRYIEDNNLVLLEKGLDERFSLDAYPRRIMPFDSRMHRVVEMNSKERAAFELVEGSDTLKEEAAKFWDIMDTWDKRYAKALAKYGVVCSEYKEERKAAEDIGYLKDLQNIVEASDLPIQLEEDYWREFSPRGIHFIRHMKSQKQAERVEDAIRFSEFLEGDQEIHLLVEAGHKPQVRKYLEQEKDASSESLMDSLLGWLPGV